LWTRSANSSVADPQRDRPLVGHVVDQFLASSETFIYGYLSSLRSTRAAVFASERLNEKQFPFADVSLYWGRPNLPVRAVLRAARVLDPQIDEKLRRAGLGIRLFGRRPALVHAHFGGMGMRAAAACRTLRIPLIVSFYGIDMSYFPRIPSYAAELAPLFRQADLVLALGERMKARLVALGCPPAKLRIQHVGADLDKFTYVPRTRQPGDPVRFLFCGRFVEKKGVPFLLRAFAEVSRRLSHVELTLIGDGGLRPEIESLIAQLGIARAVRLLGMQPHQQVAAEMSRAHILVGPSVTAESGDDEGGVLTCGIEGSASGLPLIATRHADIPEQLIEGETGLMVDERDVPALAAAMLELAENPTRWPSMGAAGRRLIEQRFDVVKETSALERLYFEVLRDRSSRAGAHGPA
jgi:colanic acid/amylovoran biosynthesis glycosyltransferase